MHLQWCTDLVEKLVAAKFSIILKFSTKDSTIGCISNGTEAAFISVTCLFLTLAVGHMGTRNSLKRPLQNPIAPFFNAEITWEDSITPIVIRDSEMQKRQCKD